VVLKVVVAVMLAVVVDVLKAPVPFVAEDGVEVPPETVVAVTV
jgi:hypothetical protein